MAIATDAFSGGYTATTATSLTYAHNVGTGSDRLLVVGAGVGSTSNLMSGVTYNGSALTSINSQLSYQSNSYFYLFYTLNPASGNNNVVVSVSSVAYIRAVSGSYTGVRQSSQPDSSDTDAPSSGGTLTGTVTTTTDGCWGICVAGFQRVPTASTNSTERVATSAGSLTKLFDSNGAISPAGSFSMSVTAASSQALYDSLVMAAFAPAAAAPTFVPKIIMY